MNKLFIFLIATSLNASYWSIGLVESKGLSMKIVCKNGYLTDIIYGKMNGIEVHYEQEHCVDVSSWNRGCLHSPIKCDCND